MNKMLSKKVATLILFLEGFVSVSIQMLVMRQLVPFVGTSHVVTSLVIGIFLASLSLGYVVGGRVKENHIQCLLRNTTIAIFFIGFGLAYITMSTVFNFLSDVFNQPVIEVSIYLLFFLSPIVFLLGQTVPLLTNFYKSSTVSETAGNAFAMNTVGSVLGSIVTALFLFQYFGVANTIIIDMILLFVVCFLFMNNKQYIKYGTFIISLIFGAFIYNTGYERSNFILTNVYTNYEVIEEEALTVFRMNDSSSSAIYKDGKSWKYIEYVKAILFGRGNQELRDSDILVLGAGGFTLSMADDLPKNNYTYVDIDPDIKKVAEEYFLKEPIKGNFVAEDARLFVRKSDKKYDAVLVDLYSNKTTIPWHVLTTEFIKDVRNTTKEGGIVVFNIISGGFFDDEYGRAIYNTINVNFPYCHSFPFNYRNERTNILYSCKNIREDKKKIYIDNISNSISEELSTGN